MSKLTELDVQDKVGNIVISPDLKVRHKDSQYEYTVDTVIEDEDGEPVVLLRMPEEPRVDTDVAPPDPSLMADLQTGDVLYEIDPSVVVYEPEKGDKDDDDLLAVPKEEFEKEYEVK